MSVPGPPMQDVVARAAEEGVVAGAAEQHVVAVAAVEREQRRAGGHAGGVDDVVAGQRVDRQPVAAGDAPETVTRRGEAGDLRVRPGAA